MIFATVGTQLPFDRLIGAIDKWSLNQRDSTSFAQIGAQGVGPKNISFASTITPLQFAKHIAECKVIVSHAGMGTILTALQVCKPIIIMPRLAKYGEHRNDHQLATVANLRSRKGIHVAKDEKALFEKLDHLQALKPDETASVAAESKLLAAIRGFIATGTQEATHA